jgi:hypothetical protein
VGDQRTEIPRRFPKWLALAALGAFVATLAVAHLGVGVFLSPREVSAAQKFEEFWMIDRQSPRRMTVVGTSLSQMGNGTNSLAARIESLMGWQPGAVVNACSNGYQIGDLFAELISARQAGSPVALVELNPYLFNERQRLPAPRPERSVTREPRNAITIFPHASMLVRWQIVRQFGLQGAMDLMVSDFSLSRLRDSSLMEPLGVFRTWLFALQPPKAPPRYFRNATGREKSRQMTCRNFAAKDVEGMDLDVYEDLLAWAASQRSRMKVLLFIWPLNRKMVAECGTDALDRLNAVVDELVDEAHRRGVPIADLSHALDGHDNVFFDYGHLEHPDDFFLWQPELSRFLSSTVSNQKDS